MKVSGKSALRKFFREEQGNFALFTAILAPVLVMGAGLAVDVTNALSMKTSLQNAVDGAALATAARLAEETITPAQAELYAVNFFKGIVGEEGSGLSKFNAVPTVKVTPKGSGKKTSWTVQLKAVGVQAASGMSKLAGQDEFRVAVSGTSESGRDESNPISMILVLDRSGSMGWNTGKKTWKTVPKYCNWGRRRYQCGTQTGWFDQTKMDALQDAVSKLVTHIDESDETAEYARIGAVSYSTTTNAKDILEPNWNKSVVSNFANNLTAGGFTNSSKAMKWAYETVTGSGEVNAHFSKNGSKNPKKFIVFMTDGENFGGQSWVGPTADAKTKEYCEAAKDEGTYIFSVAFQAPIRGKELLGACATNSSYYYNADDADELTEAFESIGEEAVRLSTRLTH